MLCSEDNGLIPTVLNTGSSEQHQRQHLGTCWTCRLSLPPQICRVRNAAAGIQNVVFPQVLLVTLMCTKVWEPLPYSLGFPPGSVVKNLPANAGDVGSITWVGKIPLEKKMATYSSILAWRIPGIVEPDRLQSMGVTESWRQLSMHACSNMPYDIVLSITFSKHLFNPYHGGSNKFLGHTDVVGSGITVWEPLSSYVPSPVTKH